MHDHQSSKLCWNQRSVGPLLCDVTVKAARTRCEPIDDAECGWIPSGFDSSNRQQRATQIKEAEGKVYDEEVPEYEKVRCKSVIIFNNSKTVNFTLS